MAKIENTTVYPTVTPAASDLLIATDVSDNNKTVTFLVSSIVGAGGVLQDLQSVLDTGNTAVQNINLTGNMTIIGTAAPTTITAAGSTGTAGQILSSTGTGLAWITPGTKACCGWEETLVINPTTTVDAIIQGAKLTVGAFAGGGIDILAPSTLTNSGTSTFTGVASINGTQLSFNTTGQINDSTGSTGVAGEWLISQGPGLGVEWSNTKPAGSSNTLQEVLSAGNTSLNTGMTFTGTSIISLSSGVTILSSGNNLWSGTNTFNNNGNTATTAGIALTGTLWDGTSIGTAGQVLTSTGSGVLWAAAASGGGNNLQQVLDLGNIATGANANITISGALKTGTIIDSSGSAGAVGQYLSINGSGLSWVNNTCCNLQDVLNVGSTATTSIVLSGAGISLTAPTVIPGLIQDGGGSVGLANQVLTINAAGTALEWNAAPAAGVSSLTNVIATSVGAPLSLSSTTGAIVLTSHEYAGGTNVGYVPTGGNNDPLLFLNGAGNWTAASGGGAVTSVSIGAIAVSTGNPLVITPTTGAVLVTPQRYNGFTNEGFVPRGGGATTFLRGDGSWAIPPGGSGVTSLTAAYAPSTGLPMDLSAATGAITISSYAYTGGTNVGHVPIGGLGDPNRSLRGDGTWAVQDVTSVTAGAPSGSTGLALTVTPTVGAVTVTSHSYTGGTEVGHVPVGGGQYTGKSLRGDGSWQYVDGNSFGVNFRMLGQKITAGTSYFALPGASGLDASFQSNGVKPVSVNAPSTGTWLADELEGAVIHMNGKTVGGTCDTEDQILCGATSTISSITNGTFVTELWKVAPCTAAVPVLIGTATSVIPGPLPTPPNTGNLCVSFVLSGTVADQTIQPGEQIIATQRFNFLTSFSYINNIALTVKELPKP